MAHVKSYSMSGPEGIYLYSDGVRLAGPYPDEDTATFESQRVSNLKKDAPIEEYKAELERRIMANYGDEAIRGPVSGPALEAIRQMREEQAAERMRAIEALLARLQGHERTGQEQMGQSPRDQRFWMNEGARREPVPTATRGGPSQIPMRSGGRRGLLPTISPPALEHEMLSEMSGGPEPMYGRNRPLDPDFRETMARLVRQRINPSSEVTTYGGGPVGVNPISSLVRRARAPLPHDMGYPSPQAAARRGPPPMHLRRRGVSPYGYSQYEEPPFRASENQLPWVWR